MSAPFASAGERLASLAPGSVGRRATYVLLLNVGVLMTAFGSYLFNQIPPIPWKFIPDLRTAFLILSATFLGVNAAGGSHARRTFALHGVLGYVIAFHLEEATVHWIGPIPGSITGTRVGLVGTAGSLLALASVLLLHVEVEAGHLRADLRRRGAKPEDVDAAVERLAAAGKRKVWGATAGVAALGVFLFVLEKGFGDAATGGSYILLVGGGLLLVLALYLLRLVPGAGKA